MHLGGAYNISPRQWLKYTFNSVGDRSEVADNLGHLETVAELGEWEDEIGEGKRNLPGMFVIGNMLTF